MLSLAQFYLLPSSFSGVEQLACLDACCACPRVRWMRQTVDRDDPKALSSWSALELV